MGKMIDCCDIERLVIVCVHPDGMLELERACFEGKSIALDFSFALPLSSQLLKREHFWPNRITAAGWCLKMLTHTHTHSKTFNIPKHLSFSICL